MEFRVEHDTMGEVRVPAHALWRAQTQRAVENFPISGRPLERSQIRALGLLKGAAARVNAKLGVLEPDLADAIADAADDVAAGKYDDHFPLDVFQTGSGTSSNMNANEVIATLASRALGRDVHPNDHVNASQSSNDTFPTTIHVAATEAVVTDVIPALDHLATTIERRAAEWGDLVKAGRTHLMDAVPVTFGQEAGAWAAQVRYGIERLESGLGRLAELPIGGTAVGSGLNAPDGFGAAVAAELAAATGLPLVEARDHFEAQASQDGVVETSGQLRTVAVSLSKIANDVRWLGSGPRTGLAELALPDLQPGSSIMPGKVNPVICEATLQVVAQVIGNDAAVAYAGAQGNFQLNVNLPVIARNVLESAKLIAAVSRLLADKVFAGVQVNAERARDYAEGSPAIVTPLNRYLGYEEAASIAKQALKERKPIRDVVLERGHVDAGRLTLEQLDSALDVLRMARGGR
ncbi:MAG TPA: class II fumarate hydratase [Pseudonocardiaceae bacterium]|nr:class II fumarate hydratase [Pseudonocardiaceae bacterium]